MTNTGNTASTYHVQLVGDGPDGDAASAHHHEAVREPGLPELRPLRAAAQPPGRQRREPEFVDPNLPPNPAITDPSDGNATFVLGPGESILVTIRGPVDIPTLTNIIQNLAPVVVAHAPNSNDTTQPSGDVPARHHDVGSAGRRVRPVLLGPSSRPSAERVRSYSLDGDGPAGQPLDQRTTTGLISGTPSATGTFSVGVSVKDSASKTGSRTYTPSGYGVLSSITTASLPNGTVGTAYSQPLAAAGGTWDVHVEPRERQPAARASSSQRRVSLPARRRRAERIRSRSGHRFGVPRAGRHAGAEDHHHPRGPSPPSSSQARLASVVGGQPFTLRFRVQDSLGAAIPGAIVSLSLFASTPCPAAILSSAPSATTDAAGLAQFTNVSIDRGGPGFTIAAASTLGGNGTVVGVSPPILVEGFCATGSTSTARSIATMTKLPDGHVLYAGGSGLTGTLEKIAEIYDPVTGVFTPTTGTMNVARAGHQAVLLPDGTVLIVGGAFSSGTVAEAFNPATGNVLPDDGRSWSGSRLRLHGDLGAVDPEGADRRRLLPRGRHREH